jgi:hypothetical protein
MEHNIQFPLGERTQNWFVLKNLVFKLQVYHQTETFNENTRWGDVPLSEKKRKEVGEWENGKSVSSQHLTTLE